MFSEIIEKFIKIEKKFQALNAFFSETEILNKLSVLEKKTLKEEFWQDTINAKNIMSKINMLKNKIENNKKISKIVVDLKEIIDLYKENEISMNEELALSSELETVEKAVSDYEISLILNGKYDTSNAIFSIAAGAGGTDAQDWAEMLFRMYCRWFEKNNFRLTITDISEGTEAGIKGVSVIIEGDYAFGYLKAENGIHRLVRLSPFNANNKRQTSFAAVEVIPEILKDNDVIIKDEDLKIDTFRASGAGGQHVNKTDSAVRLSHMPSGIIVQCQSERSQLQNKENAMKILVSRLVQKKDLEYQKKISNLKGNAENAWGNQIRSYVFHPYNLVKDHRTNIETANVQSVMDGEISFFIEEFLRRGDIHNV